MKDEISMIERHRIEGNRVDVMGGNCRIQADVHNHGFVALVDVMPRLVPEGQTADFAIAQAARVSYGAGTRKAREDRNLIRYLMRKRHTSPFEMIETKWHVRLPIFVARQWIRHRTANVNEYSGRYSLMRPEFWRPDGIRLQSESNKQSSFKASDEKLLDRFLIYLEDSERQYNTYARLVDGGLGKEMARTGLPLSMYTEWYWKIDLHNLLHFLSLRMDEHAQQEIQDYAKIMFEIMEGIAPVTMEAFQDYVLNKFTLTGPELWAIGRPLDEWKERLSSRESDELMCKREYLLDLITDDE